MEPHVELRELVQGVIRGESHSCVVWGTCLEEQKEMVDACLKENVENLGEDGYLLVYLHGALLTDYQALREITRRMALSTNTTSCTFEETFQDIIEQLRHKKRPAIFVLEEIDRFAHSGKQTLLYNLFDLVHSDKYPFLVIGTTQRVDFLEHLEKRVKSRFSQKLVHVPSPDFEHVVSRIEHIVPLNAELIAQLKELYDVYGDPKMLQVRIQYMKALGRSTLVEETDHFLAAAPDLCLLELVVLIAIKQLRDRQELFNFEMVCDAFYRLLNTKQHSLHVITVNKAVLRGVFERFVGMQVLAEQDRTSCFAFRMHALAIDPSYIIQALQQHPDANDDLVHLAKRVV